MVDAQQVNNDRVWFVTTYKLLTRDLFHIAQRNPGSYQSVFVLKAGFIQKKLAVPIREATTGKDSEYFNDLRVMFRLYLDMTGVMITTLKGANAMMSKHQKLIQLIDELNSVEHISSIKTGFNELIKVISSSA